MIEWIPVAERLPEWDRYDVGKSVAVTIEVVEVDKPNRVCDIVEFYAATPDCHAVFCDEFGEIEGVVAWAEVEPYMGEVKP